MTNAAIRYEKLVPLYEAASQEAATRERTIPLADLESRISAFQEVQASSIERLVGRVGLIDAITSDPDVSAIAEHKRRSPSEGDIKPYSQVSDTVMSYDQGGATALSILTQNQHFGGRIEDLSEARAHCDLPVLRKDFISTEYQLYEARAHGAAAALLIVGGLSDQRLVKLQSEAAAIGLDCLIEVHTAEEMQRALQIGPSLVGINNRDLTTMKVDLSTAEQLRPMVPENIPVVAESGYKLNQPGHIQKLRELDFNAVLMGTDLMINDNPAEALAAWLATE